MVGPESMMVWVEEIIAVHIVDYLEENHPFNKLYLGCKGLLQVCSFGGEVDQLSCGEESPLLSYTEKGTLLVGWTD